ASVGECGVRAGLGDCKRVIRTLVLVGASGVPALNPWMEYLARTGEVAVELVTDTAPLANLDGFDVVVAHAPGGHLSAGEEAGLCSFVAGGGGFVGLHCTNEQWSPGSRYREMMGGAPDGRLPRMELVADVRSASHDITRRTPKTVRVLDSCCGQGDLGADVEILLSTTWRSREVPIAYARNHGAGRVFYWGLGETVDAYASEDMRGLLYRAVRHVAGWEERASLGVGLLGFGAIGPEHTAAISRTAGLRLTAVCDRSPERLRAALADGAEPALLTEADRLLAHPEVDVVVVSTPPNTHAALAQRALEAGKHVVVEKPFCLTSAQADRLLAAAQAADLVLTVYQSRRWDPDYLALLDLVRSGALGEIFRVEAFVGGFEHPCHLWHSDSEVSGGVIYDWGAHYLDWILQLLPAPVLQVDATRQNRVWHDVTNDDQFEIRLRFEGGAEASFLHSDIAAARKPKWYVLGTRAAVVGQWREAVLSSQGPNGLVEEHLPVSDLPCELHVLRPAGRGLSHDERLSLPPVPEAAFYRNLAGHLLAREPLAVTPEFARRNIQVMEAALQAAEAGLPRTVRI
ncbi:MAG: Gfo/Idh/MocA family oxidoreductase, partial [Candidatus Dormibacteria bacterium]